MPGGLYLQRAVGVTEKTKHIIKRAWAQHVGRKRELGRERNPARQKRQGQEDRHTRREAEQNQVGVFTE